MKTKNGSVGNQKVFALYVCLDHSLVSFLTWAILFWAVVFVFVFDTQTLDQDLHLFLIHVSTYHVLRRSK